MANDFKYISITAMKTEEFWQLKNGGKSSKLALEHGELISPVWAVELMEQYADEVSRETFDSGWTLAIIEQNERNIAELSYTDREFKTVNDYWLKEKEEQP